MYVQLFGFANGSQSSISLMSSVDAMRHYEKTRAVFARMLLGGIEPTALTASVLLYIYMDV